MQTPNNLKQRLKKKAGELKRNIYALYLALKKKETPWYSKIVPAIAVAYALSPIDLIPDFIPILGYIDDILILPLLITISIKLIPKDIMDTCRIEAENLWKDGKPKKWYYAVPIVVIWLAILSLITYKIFW